MTPQLESLFSFQLALWNGWIQLTCAGFNAYNRLLLNQSRLLEHHHTYFRCENLIPQGADWDDHYGKRLHDINVEKV
ncbi:MAG: hypothetical protein F8N37_06065 [Telmatospirillum sp.]|nr:hypothetical protein [Telmatospirillum sp.]